MPYEQDFEFRPMNDRRPQDEPRYPQSRRSQDDDRRRRDDDQRRPGSRYDHDAPRRGDRHNDYDRSQPRGDYGRDQGSFSYGRRQEYDDPYDTDNSFSTSRERQNPSAFQGGLGPGHYEGDYRGGRGYYSDEDPRWRRGHQADRPENRGRQHDPYDDRRSYDRPSGYGQPGERVRQIGDQYGRDSYDGSSQGGRYRDDNRRRDDNYPGRDRARDDRDGRYHYDDDTDRRDRRR